MDHGPLPQQLELATTSISTTLGEFRERTARGLPSVRVWDAGSPTCGVGRRLARIASDTGRVEVLYEGDIRDSILYGRGVPVELAYYWGEGHVLGSPGNIHDSWLRTEGFFAKYLRMR